MSQLVNEGVEVYNCPFAISEVACGQVYSISVLAQVLEYFQTLYNHIRSLRHQQISAGLV